MPDALDPLQRQQLDIAAALQADEQLSTVTIKVDRPREAEDALAIQTALDNALAGLLSDEQREAGLKGGLAITVWMADGEVQHANIPGPGLSLIQAIRVYENPMVNMGEDGTGITAEGAALIVLNLLHLYDLGNGILVADKRPLRPVKTESGVAWDVVLNRDLGLAQRPFVQSPVMAVSGGQLTISCATAEAAIWWTHDGSMPTPSNPTALLYSGPADVTAHAGERARAAAYLTGRRASSVSERNL